MEVEKEDFLRKTKMGLKKRIIGRLDIKGDALIKTIRLEGVKKIGDPLYFAEKYYKEGADELLYMDAVATLYGRNNLCDLIKKTLSKVFIPVTVGGGIRTIDDLSDVLRSGADKVAINTAAVRNPSFLCEASKIFGRQCIVLQIDAIKLSKDCWQVLTEGGREKTGLDVIEWVRKATKLGIGEILLTSVDKEGTGEGFDYNLARMVENNTDVPIICSGGMGRLEHLDELYKLTNVNSFALAKMLHIEQMPIATIKQYAKDIGLSIRF